MRVKIKGIHSAKAKLASGEVVTYYYAWRGGPRIAAEPGTPAFFAAYAEACSGARRPQTDTLAGLIRIFEQSSKFPASASSRRAYRIYLNLIDRDFGDMPIAALASPRVRGRFMDWRDGMKDTPRKADYAMSVLSRICGVAVDRGLIAVNPCARMGRLYAADRTEKIWTDADIRQFCAVASRPLQDALVLALCTGQRQGDLLRLTWAAFDGERLRLRQSKGGAHVAIPVSGALKALLDARKAQRKASVTILTSSTGKPWTANGFGASWRKAFTKAGLGDLHFHDLRGTAVTRLALAGCSVPEIAAITGHSPDDAGRILKAHYLGGQAELAESAIVKSIAKYG